MGLAPLDPRLFDALHNPSDSNANSRPLPCCGAFHAMASDRDLPIRVGLATGIFATIPTAPLQDQTWTHVLTALAAHLGTSGEVQMTKNAVGFPLPVGTGLEHLDNA